MKLAVTYENGQIFQHFGHTEQFKIYEVADGKIVSEEVVDTNGSGHGALAGFLMQHGASAAERRQLWPRSASSSTAASAVRRMRRSMRC